MKSPILRRQGRIALVVLLVLAETSSVQAMDEYQVETLKVLFSIFGGAVIGVLSIYPAIVICLNITGSVEDITLGGAIGLVTGCIVGCFLGGKLADRLFHPTADTLESYYRREVAPRLGLACSQPGLRIPLCVFGI